MTGGFLNSQLETSLTLLQDLPRVREVSSLASSITQMSRSLWVCSEMPLCNLRSSKRGSLLHFEGWTSSLKG